VGGVLEKVPIMFGPKREVKRDSYIMRSFVICTPLTVFFVRSDVCMRWGNGLRILIGKCELMRALARPRYK
jgi:hypothetical protein